MSASKYNQFTQQFEIELWMAQGDGIDTY